MQKKLFGMQKHDMLDIFGPKDIYYDLSSLYTFAVEKSIFGGAKFFMFLRRIRVMGTLATIMLFVIMAGLMVACDGGKPSVVLAPTAVSISDSSLTATIEVGGTATGEISLETTALPVGVSAKVSEQSIIVSGVRPSSGTAGILGDYSILVSREGASAVLVVSVNLTPTSTPNSSCEICGKNPCECPTLCEVCGKNPCECPTLCEVCGKDPCECPTICKVCGKTPCVCLPSEFEALPFGFAFEEDLRIWYLKWDLGDEPDIEFCDFAVFIDRGDGNGYVFVDVVQNNNRIQAVFLNPSQNTNKIRIHNVSDIWLDGQKQTSVFAGFYQFEFARTQTTASYDFEIDSYGQILWQYNFDKNCYLYMENSDGNGYRLVEYLNWFDYLYASSLKLKVGTNKLLFADNLSYKFNGQTLVENRRAVYWELKYVIEPDRYRSMTYTVNQYGQLSWDLHRNWDVYTVDEDGVSTFRLEIGSDSLSLDSDLSLENGRNILLFIAKDARYDQTDKNTLTSYQEYGYFQFDFQKQISSHEFAFDVNGSAIMWNGESYTPYSVYLDRHDGEGFQFVEKTPLYSGSRIGLDVLNLSQGSYTLRIEEQTNWYMSSGVIYAEQRTDTWDFDVEKNTYTLAREFKLTNSNTFVSWRDTNDSRNEIVYIDRFDGLGYVLVGSTDYSSSIRLNILNPAVGTNKLMAVSRNPSTVFEDGTIKFVDIQIFWEFEYAEDEFVSDYNFYVQDELIYFDQLVSDYNAYVDHHDGNGYMPVSYNYDLWLSNLELTAGRNTLKVVSGAIWSYQNGVLCKGISTGYWELEYVAEDFWSPYAMEISGDGLVICQAFYDENIEIYVDRNDGAGFVYLTYVAYYEKISLESFDFSEGQNTIRAVSADKMYEQNNGIVSYGHKCFDFPLEVTRQAFTELELDIKIDTDSSHNGIIGGFSWEGENKNYNIYVDRHDGAGFVLKAKVSNPVVAIGRLNLAAGQNTIKIETMANISLLDDQLSYNIASGVFTVDYVPTDYQTSLDFRFAGDYLRWESNVYHYAYLDRGDGNGFVSISDWSSYYVYIENLNLTQGSYVLKLISQKEQFFLHDGTLKYGFSTSILPFEYSEADEIEIDYDYRVINESIFWNGDGYYSVYIDRHDGEGFVLLENYVYSDSGIRFETLKPTLGQNTLKVVSNYDIYNYSDGTLTLARAIGTFDFEYQNATATADFVLNYSYNEISWSIKDYYGYTNVYVDRNDGEGFVFLAKREYYNAYIYLSQLELVSSGQYSIMISTDSKTWSYEGQTALGTTRVFTQSFVYNVDTSVPEYNFRIADYVTGYGNSLPIIVWDWDSQYVYEIQVDRHDGEGFIYAGFVDGESLNNAPILANVLFTEGQNTIRLEARSAQFVDGVFTVFSHQVDWQLAVETQYTTSNFETIRINNLLVINAPRGNYLMQIDKHDGQGYSLMSQLAVGDFGASYHIGNLSLAAGQNTMLLQLVTSYEYENGTLKQKITKQTIVIQKS